MLGIRSAAGIASAFAIGMALASCAGRPSGVQGLPGDGAASGPRFVLELEPGPQYRSTTGWFIFKFPIYPQVACWIETLDGRYLDTIYVTNKGERSSWIGAPKEGRPEALPVWSGLRKGGTEAVSAATSAGATLKASDIAGRLPAGRYAVMLETNRSYDYNESYPRESSGVSGQPSLVYRCEIDVGSGDSEAAFAPIGRGSPDGSDSSIREGLQGITTALELFSGMTVRSEG